MKKGLAVISMLASSFIASLSANAVPTTNMVFEKNEYCGYHTGDISEGRLLTLHISEGQEISIPVLDRFNVEEVIDPKGNVLEDLGKEYTWNYIAKEDGKHGVYLSDDTSIDNNNAVVAICVY